MLIVTKIYLIRFWHCSWASPAGVILIGGLNSQRTSEMIQEDGSSVEGFRLEHSTQ